MDFLPGWAGLSAIIRAGLIALLLGLKIIDYINTNKFLIFLNIALVNMVPGTYRGKELKIRLRGRFPVEKQSSIGTLLYLPIGQTFLPCHPIRQPSYLVILYDNFLTLSSYTTTFLPCHLF